MRDRTPTGAGGVLIVIAALTLATGILLVTWADRERSFLAGVPQPPPLESTTVVKVAPGESACLEGATVLPESEIAQFRVGTRGKPSVPLTTSLRGADGVDLGRDRIGEGEWKDNDLLSVALRPPDRPVRGTFCVRNDGRRAVDVYGADDRSQTVAVTRVGGRPVDANMQLTFVEARPTTLRARAGRITDELTVFRPGIIGPVVVWALFVLTLAGLPLGLGFAMWRAARELEPDGPSVAPQGDAQPRLDLPGGGDPRPVGDEVEPGGRPR